MIAEELKLGLDLLPLTNPSGFLIKWNEYYQRIDLLTLLAEESAMKILTLIQHLEHDECSFATCTASPTH